MPSPRPALRLEPGGVDREQTAVRRLALLAADLGADRTEPPAVSAEPVEDEDVDGHWWADHSRVAGGAAASTDTVAPAAADADAHGPASGRHAAPRTSFLPPLPELGLAHLAVIAVVVAVALAGTTWWLLRDRAEAVVVPDLAAAEVPALVAAEETAPPEEATSSGTVVVDVAGKVRRPGIVELDEGARVVDALDAAGGPRRGVDTTDLNLARVLVDGEQILVGVRVGRLLRQRGRAPTENRGGKEGARGSNWILASFPSRTRHPSPCGHGIGTLTCCTRPSPRCR
jgi:competence protein ComEA